MCVPVLSPSHTHTLTHTHTHPSLSPSLSLTHTHSLSTVQHKRMVMPQACGGSVLLVPLLLLLIGCVCGGQQQSKAETEIAWSASNCPEGSLAPGEIESGRECAMVNVPLLGPNGDGDWLAVDQAAPDSSSSSSSSSNDPANRTIPLFVRRYLPQPRGAGQSKGQLWLIPGGPGQGGAEIAPMASMFKDEPYTIVIADHRGTGRSAFLGCPDAESTDSPGGPKIILSEWPGCIQHLEREWTHEGLHGFSTTNAARDVRFVASRIKKEEVGSNPDADYKVVLLGSSYGTLVAGRAVLIEEEEQQGQQPGQQQEQQQEHASSLDHDHGIGRVVDAVVFDGTVYPKGYSLLAQVDFFTAALRVIFDACANDDACRAYLGREPYNMLDTLISRMREGHCRAAGFDPEAFRLFLGMITSLQPLGRPHIMAAASVVRFLRCDRDDVAVLQGLGQRMNELIDSVQQALTAAPAFSQAALMVISAQEVVSDLPAGNDNFWSNADARLDLSLGSLFVHPRVITYPAGLMRLRRDPYANRSPSTLHASVLILSGLLDANTPHLFARLAYLDYAAAAAAATGTNDTGTTHHPAPPPKMLIASTSGHGVLGQDERSRACVVQWLADPHAFDADTCMPYVALDFAAPSDADVQLLGENPFGQAATVGGPADLFPVMSGGDAIAAAVDSGVLASADEVNGAVASASGEGHSSNVVVAFAVLNFVVLLALCGGVVLIVQRSSKRSPSGSNYSLQEQLLESSNG